MAATAAAAVPAKKVAKFLVREGTHLEPDPTDTTFKQENRTQRERMYKRGEVFESTKNRVRQFGSDKFSRVPDDTPVTPRAIYTSESERYQEEIEAVEATPVTPAAATHLTEKQMETMPFGDLKAHCDAIGIDLKGLTDRKKIINLILEHQKADDE